MEEYYSYKETKIPVRVRYRMKVRVAEKERSGRFGQTVRGVFIGLFAFAALLGTSGLSILVSAFEAHVINVTAKIEPAPTSDPVPDPVFECQAVNLRYWKHGEGCSEGLGSSAWVEEVNELSGNFSGVFAQHTGEQICQDVWTQSCPEEGIEGIQCRARARTLAGLLNVVSGRLALDALVDGADDGSEAFDRLNLDAHSTVKQALEAVEQILANSEAPKQQLRDARHVVKRVVVFYKKENPIAGQCVLHAQEFDLAMEDDLLDMLEDEIEENEEQLTEELAFEELPPEEAVEEKTEEKVEEHEEQNESLPEENTSEAITEGAEAIEVITEEI